MLRGLQGWSVKRCGTLSCATTPSVRVGASSAASKKRRPCGVRRRLGADMVTIYHGNNHGLSASPITYKVPIASADYGSGDKDNRRLRIVPVSRSAAGGGWKQIDIT